MSCLCDQCAALCCRYFALPIDNPTTARQFDDIRWYLCHENVVVFIEKKQWYLGILTRCKHLQEDNRCGIYETRPKICRGYSTDNCDYHGGEYDWEKLFTSAEQLREYGLEYLRKRRERRKAKKNGDGKPEKPQKPRPKLEVTLRKPVSQVKGHPSLHRKAKRAERNGKVLAPAVLAPFNGNGAGRMTLPILRP